MRKPKPKKKKPTQALMDYQALERENLKLQREIAALKAQLVSARNRSTAEYEDRTATGMSEADWDQVRADARRMYGPQADTPQTVRHHDDPNRNA